MDEQAQHEAALEVAAMLLAKRANLHVWHLPDWVGDYHENTDEADDVVAESEFGSKLEALRSFLATGKMNQQAKLSKEDLLGSFKPIPQEDLYDPEEYNPANFPWYRTDDPNVAGLH